MTGTNHLQTREARGEDYHSICQVYKDGDQYHHSVAPGVFKKYEGPARPRTWFDLYMANECRALLVAEMDQQIVAVLSLRSSATPPVEAFEPCRFVVVDDIIVREAYRGRGIGKHLMSCAAAWGRERGLERIRLSVYSQNARALSFYQRLGFQPLMSTLETDIPRK